MKQVILAFGFSLVVMASAFADQPGSDWISKEALKRQMAEAGYTAIVVEADDGHWEGEALKDGQIVEFHADPRTGIITKSKVKTED
jgi:Peptidase propeptide and YPEB domain